MPNPSPAAMKKRKVDVGPGYADTNERIWEVMLQMLEPNTKRMEVMLANERAEREAQLARDRAEREEQLARDRIEREEQRKADEQKCMGAIGSIFHRLPDIVRTCVDAIAPRPLLMIDPTQS